MDAVKRTGKPFIAAVSGVKNSGKTTFMEKLISVPMLTVLSRKSSPILMQILKKNLQTHRNSVNQKLLKSSMRQIKNNSMNSFYVIFQA